MLDCICNTGGQIFILRLILCRIQAMFGAYWDNALLGTSPVKVCLQYIKTNFVLHCIVIRSFILRKVLLYWICIKCHFESGCTQARNIEGNKKLKTFSWWHHLLMSFVHIRWVSPAPLVQCNSNLCCWVQPVRNCFLHVLSLRITRVWVKLWPCCQPVHIFSSLFLLGQEDHHVLIGVKERTEVEQKNNIF